MKPRKHKDLIIAWANGAEIQYQNHHGQWMEASLPNWDEFTEYRIKPEPKPDIVRYVSHVHCNGDTYFSSLKKDMNSDLKITFDGETWKIKSVEVING